ncbi:hypothetical protein BRADI_4g37192v3 [Brachypodium distachyon]|uniref:Uncharacterized protein n=1 Tax=Brachypodium distachyon TaxID=15368 RepID=A0A2K2CST8_BRADI|nr:hypothetical protein BRADI_4g37192v3 [Brachypodium distachyon]
MTDKHKTESEELQEYVGGISMSGCANYGQRKWRPAATSPCPRNPSLPRRKTKKSMRRALAGVGEELKIPTMWSTYF